MDTQISNNKLKRRFMNEELLKVGESSVLTALFVGAVSGFKHIFIYATSHVLLWTPSVMEDVKDFTEIADLIVKSGGAIYICLKIYRFFKHKKDSKNGK